MTAESARQKIRALLEKRGNFKEQGMKKDLFIADTGASKVGADIFGEKPVVGVFLNGKLEEEGHGIAAVSALRTQILAIWEKEVVHPAPVPKEVNHEEKHQEAKAREDAKAQKPEAKPSEKVKEETMDNKKDCKLLDLIKSYVGNDVLEVFGDSGTGKSKFALEFARQVIASGKTVFYLDTERNLTEDDVALLKGSQYKYTPILNEIDQISRQGLPKVDVVIIDSIGFPVLTEYARMTMKQKGDALLKLIAIFGDLKEWAYRNNGVAVVINQPESDFNKEPGHLIRPFGDKSQFAAKEIWKTELVQRGKVTKVTINAFRSRSVGHGTKIADMEISEKGIEVKEAKA